MKTNFMFDVGFTVEGPWEFPEDVPEAFLLLGMQKRLLSLQEALVKKTECVSEAFGFCDSYKIP
jgi:hypothetical protein